MSTQFIPPAVTAATWLAGLCALYLLLDGALFFFQVLARAGATAVEASAGERAPSRRRAPSQVLGGGGVLARVWLTFVVPLDLLMARTLYVYLESQKWGDLELSLPEMSVQHKGASASRPAPAPVQLAKEAVEASASTAPPSVACGEPEIGPEIVM